MNPEIFTLPYGEKFILYAPLMKFAAVINSGAKDAVAKRLKNSPVEESQQGVISMLEKHKIFSEIKPPCVDENFSPNRVTLFPTDRCNLRCKYCYAEAEDGGNKLSFAAAKAAIDFIADNAKKNGFKDFSVGFHGNGEPFSAFDVIREVCEYTVKKAEELQMKTHISVATNGVMDDEKLDYLIAWISDANISSDILPDIQNAHRPDASGKNTFERVDKTLKRLGAAGVQFGIRATITSETVHRMEEMALYVKENYPKCNLLHLEPVFEIGRAVETKKTAPEPKTFVREYIKAQDVLRGGGTKVVFSGARQETLCCSFCSVCNNAFTVTAEGNVTACYEICTYKDPRAPRYIYGKFDGEKFFFEKNKLKELAGLHVGNIPHCKDCFAKWHCGGDCVAKVLGTKSVDAHTGSPRCVMTRALIYRQILEKLGIETVGVEPTFL
jgi:uncharacterized protein